VNNSLSEHQTIVEAIEKGDPVATQRALSDHVLIQGERFSDFVSSVRRMEAPLEKTG
jgi:DNA-binding FadR family transcriptional regulator